MGEAKPYLWRSTAAKSVHARVDQRGFGGCLEHTTLIPRKGSRSFQPACTMLATVRCVGDVEVIRKRVISAVAWQASDGRDNTQARLRSARVNSSTVAVII